MNTNDLLQRIDACAVTGKMITAAQMDGKAGETGSSEGLHGFCSEIKDIIDDVFGDGSQLAANFELIDGGGPEALNERLDVLAYLRRVTAYSGEFSS